MFKVFLFMGRYCFGEVLSGYEKTFVANVFLFHKIRNKQIYHFKEIKNLTKSYNFLMDFEFLLKDFERYQKIRTEDLYVKLSAFFDCMNKDFFENLLNEINLPVKQIYEYEELKYSIEIKQVITQEEINIHLHEIKSLTANLDRASEGVIESFNDDIKNFE